MLEKHVADYNNSSRNRFRRSSDGRNGRMCAPCRPTTIRTRALCTVCNRRDRTRDRYRLYAVLPPNRPIFDRIFDGVIYRAVKTRNCAQIMEFNFNSKTISRTPRVNVENKLLICSRHTQAHVTRNTHTHTHA